MNDPSVLNIGIASAVVMLILKEVFAFILKIVDARKTNGSKEGAVPPAMQAGIKDMERDFLAPIKRMTAELHAWHDVNDRDGVKIWYVRPSLAEAIRDLSLNISTQTDVLKEMLRLQHKTIEKLED